MKNTDCNNENKIYTIASIDERYYKTGYVCEYIKVYGAYSDVYSVVRNRDKNSHLNSLFNGFDVKYYSGELNGYEEDTPNKFDFIVK